MMILESLLTIGVALGVYFGMLKVVPMVLDKFSRK